VPADPARASSAYMSSYQGKVVLVTGGAKGIGRMISEGFVANGAKVYISSRDAKACEQAAQEMNRLGTLRSRMALQISILTIFPI